MTTAILAAAFFVASLVHVPLGPGSVHLLLLGLLGAFLGWGTFPALLVGLALQAVLFQFGGLTVLGVNTFCMAAPAVASQAIFARLLAADGRRRALGAFGCGFVAVLLSALCMSAALTFTDEGFLSAAELLVAAHVPIMVIEGFITMFAVTFVARVRPELLQQHA
jgi:cobalt/nickel transport system permease protein